MEAYYQGVEAKFHAQSSNNMKAVWDEALTSVMELDLVDEEYKTDLNQII